MLHQLKEAMFVKQIRKSLLYASIRQLFPMPEKSYFNDRDHINDAEVVLIDWPENVKKPRFGIVKDYGIYPRWTKYCRFLDNNSFNYDFYNIHASDWIEKAADYDIIIGITGNDYCELQELRKKFFVLENFLTKACYPSMKHIFLYEDKGLEAHIAKITGLPFAYSYISNDKQEAYQLLDVLKYPVVSKIENSSGSIGVELVKTKNQGRKIINQVFSMRGRGSQLSYYRQKNTIYFQDFIPNDGYDIRVIVVGSSAFGYYRKVLKGDFRASGMEQVEKRALPEEAIRIAFKMNKVIKSPQLVVDMVHGLDGNYSVIEYSILCQMEFPEQLHVNGVPGVYIFDNAGNYYFKPGRYWVHELALKEFLQKDYLENL